MYYPKSQIKTDLYTNGGEYALSTTQQEYKGYYYEISNGEKYTGKTPQDAPNILLVDLIKQDLKSPPNQTDFSPENQLVYSLIKPLPNSLPNRFLPLFNLTLPTDKDKSLGVFSRYFCKKTNELVYLEIDKPTYDKLQNKDSKIAWDLYIPQTLLWQIKGNKEQTYIVNKNIIALLEQRQQWYGFSKYLKEDYLKYYLGE